MRYLSFLLPLLLICLNCASAYKPIEPARLDYSQATDTLYLSNGKVAIGWRYNILKEAKNRRYARNERDFGVSLLGMSITNLSTDTIFLPGNLTLWTGDELIYPLYLDEAEDALRQTFVEENGGAESGDIFIDITYFIFNASIQGKANKRFRQELIEYYLYDSYVPPGEAVAGLLALPLRKGTPLMFKIGEKPEDRE